jgi:hypothetical protein
MREQSLSGVGRPAVPVRGGIALLVALLFPLGALTGCIKGDAPQPAKTAAAAATPAQTNFTLPDDRGVSAAANETNRTEAGAGGVQHTHDYWKGKLTIVVFQGDVALSPFPVFPEGQGSNPASTAYVKIPQPMLVYEGTSELDVTLKSPSYEANGLLVPDPVPPGLKLDYRTAASDKFVAAPSVTIGAPIVIPVTPQETDMPHSVSSLWAFRITADKPSLASLNVTITIKRGAAILSWPGHPDFYGDKTERVIEDKT